MKAFTIDASAQCPKILFDPENNIFEISGVSKPEDVRKFYSLVLDWINEFSQKLLNSEQSTYSKTNPLTINFKLMYFNSSSAKFIFDIIEEFQKIEENGIPTRIVWYYDREDDDMRDAGQEMSELIEKPFEFIALDI